MSTIVGILKIATRTNGVGDCSEQDKFLLFLFLFGCGFLLLVVVVVFCVFLIYLFTFSLLFLYLPIIYVLDRLDDCKTHAQFISCA